MQSSPFKSGGSSRLPQETPPAATLFLRPEDGTSHSFCRAVPTLRQPPPPPRDAKGCGPDGHPQGFEVKLAHWGGGRSGSRLRTPQQPPALHWLTAAPEARGGRGARRGSCCRGCGDAQARRRRPCSGQGAARQSSEPPFLPATCPGEFGGRRFRGAEPFRKRRAAGSGQGSPRPWRLGLEAPGQWGARSFQASAGGCRINLAPTGRWRGPFGAPETSGRLGRCAAQLRCLSRAGGRGFTHQEAERATDCPPSAGGPREPSQPLAGGSLSEGLRSRPRRLMARDGTGACPGNPGAAGIQEPPCNLEDDEVFLGSEARPSSTQADPFRHCSVEELYELLETLGSGHFGVVRRCQERSTGVFYAAKSVKVRKRKGSRLGLEREQMEREVCILQQLQHPNIMRLYDVFANQAEMVLILELILGGELFDFIAEKELLSEDEAIEFLQQILLGLAYMHALHVAHFDLKPENIMLLEKGTPKPKIKIIDFGLAQKLQEGVAYKSLCGTPQYIAPEVINYEALSTATDMWSIGVITYILLSGMSPFQGETDEETLSNVVSGNYEFEAKYFSQTSEMAKDFIQKLLLKEPRDRMTAAECLLHPWIKPLTRKQAMNRSRSSINMKNFRKFNARRKWKLSYHMVSACNRLCRLRLLCQQQKPEEEVTALRDCESDQEDQPSSPGVLLRRRRSICS